MLAIDNVILVISVFSNITNITHTAKSLNNFHFKFTPDIKQAT